MGAQATLAARPLLMGFRLPSGRVGHDKEVVPLLSYEQTMALGQAEYQDVINELVAAGLPAVFTQTGGMNAALELRLDGGYTVLITEADDSLSWSRAEHRDWGVALYAPEQAYDGEVLAAEVTEDGTAAGLLRLVEELLRAAVRG